MVEEPFSGPAHLWQLMVTNVVYSTPLYVLCFYFRRDCELVSMQSHGKPSRLSPFANTKAQKGRKERREAFSRSNQVKSNKFDKWSSIINAASLSRKRVLLPVNKIRKSLNLSSELHRTLYGFIVFEVPWTNVRGINYLNELQTDTSLAIEAKVMQRWEFDSIEQAASCMSSWFSGTHSDQLHLKEYLDSVIGEVFYDAEENFSRIPFIDDNENRYSSDLWDEDNSPHSFCGPFSVYPGTTENSTSEPHTPPPTGPYKRRRIIKSTTSGVEDSYSEETKSPTEHLTDKSDSHGNDIATTIETKQYQDVLILFRFNDCDLPFRLKQIIMADLRLLTLLEAGLPSWVIFLQSYPGFCHLYRPWMCPLARTLYVLISVVTVLIGFYDLYKNVPVLKATASRLCGPLFDWVESWEMVTRIKYLGTMLFLHNFEKAVTWFLTLTRTTRSFFSVFTQPLAEPLMEFISFLLPAWNILLEVVERLFSAVGILCDIVGDLFQIILWPVWSLTLLVWKIATLILYPIFWMLWELFYTPVRLILALASYVALILTWILELIGDVWRSISSIFHLASTSQVTVSTYEVSIWRSLWNDLFSQVFRAIRSILNGFVAFFAACNRHRLSIYNHVQDFIIKLQARAPRSHCSAARNRSQIHGSQSPPAASRKVHVR